MEALKIGLMTIAAIISTAIISACAHSASAGSAVVGAGPPTTGTAYYYGQASFFSADGKLPYGWTDSAVKREILDAGARIIETATQPGAGHSMPAVEIVTELRRRQKTLVYDAAGAGGTLTGVVTFKDAELKAWTYTIKLKAGGSVKISGTLTAQGIKTEKRLYGAGRPMTVKEDLKAVSARVYEMYVNGMRPALRAE